MENGKITAAEAAAGVEAGGLSERLSTMEELLRESVKQNKKLTRSRAVMALLMALLVLVFAWGLYWLNSTVTSITEDVPALITSTNISMRQLQTTLEGISAIDFATLNNAITEIDQGLGSVDFNALNQSIVELQEVTEGLARFMNMFG